MGFSRQEYYSELPGPPPGDLPVSGIQSISLTSPALAGRFLTLLAPLILPYYGPNFGAGLFFFLTIYLVVLGLSCGTQDFPSLWQHIESLNCGSRTLSCGMWALVPWPGIEPWPPALGAWSLSHWTTKEVPDIRFLTRQEFKFFQSSASDKINSCVWSPAIVSRLGWGKWSSYGTI